jgi:hypothetical protein
MPSLSREEFLKEYIYEFADYFVLDIVPQPGQKLGPFSE